MEDLAPSPSFASELEVHEAEHAVAHAYKPGIDELRSERVVVWQADSIASHCQASSSCSSHKSHSHAASTCRGRKDFRLQSDPANHGHRIFAAHGFP